MATLTRKALAAMGIEEAQADEIIGIHTEVVNEIKDERDRYKSEAKDLESAKKELEALKDEMGKGDRSPYKKKYEDEVKAKESLQEEFDSYKAEVEAKATASQKESAYRKLLLDAGVSEKRIEDVLIIAKAKGKFDSIEVDEDGKVKDSDKLAESIKSDFEDYIVHTETHGANTATPPANNGGNQDTANAARDRAARYYAQHYGEIKEV